MAEQQGQIQPNHNYGSILHRSADQQQELRRHILSQPADRFAGKPWELLAEIESFAKQIGLRMIYQSTKIATSKNALSAVEPKPKVFVEFGTFVGTSAIAWATLLREFHGPDAKDVKVFTFEFDPKVAEVARDLIKVAGLDDVVEVFVGPGSESLKKLHAEGRVKPGGVDTVFIDHWEQYYLPDLKLCEELKLFHKGSVVIADNTDMPGAPDYLAYVQKGGEGSVKYKTESIMSASSRGPNIVEVSTVVDV